MSPRDQAPSGCRPLGLTGMGEEQNGVVVSGVLGGLLLAGAGATVVAVRRVRTPMSGLPNGTRVA